jgi:hypothetical protein
MDGSLERKNPLFLERGTERERERELEKLLRKGQSKILSFF